MFGRAMYLRVLAIALSGLMLAVLVPPYSFSGLVWFCMVPLFIAVWTLKGKHRAKKGFLIGYLVGLISFGIQISWLATVSWLGPIVLGGYLALYFGIFGAFAATLGNPFQQADGTPLNVPLRSLLFAFNNAAVFAGLEVLRGWLFTGFGWNGLGVAFHETAVMAQGADLLGVAGLSLAVVFFQGVLVQVGQRMFRAGAEGIRVQRWDFIVAAMAIGMLLFYGLLRISTEQAKDSVTLKALLVQINIPHEGAQVLWSPEEVHMAYEEETIRALEKMATDDEKRLQEVLEVKPEGDEGGSEEGNEEASIEITRADWVLWPETALAGRVVTTDDGQWGAWQQNVDTINRVRDGQPAFDLIYGAVEIEGEAIEQRLIQKSDPRFYNSIIVDDQRGGFQAFRKHHLVIFGETIPFMDTLPFLKKIYEDQSGQTYQGSFTSGVSLEPLKTKLGDREIQIIPAVCFEDTVPRLTRKFVRNKPQIIVNLTNDGWFKTTPAAAQHFANARFRAIELRRPMLRCANTGVSAAVDTIGGTTHPKTGEKQMILDENGSSFVRGSRLVEVRIPIQPGFSLYSIIGDFGILVLALVGLVSSILGRKLKFGNSFDPTDPFGKKRVKNVNIR